MELISDWSAEEKEAIAKLRLNLGELVGNLESTEDAFLLRWLRARDLNVDNAREMLQNYVDWKEQSEDYQLAHDNTWKAPQIVADEFKYKFTGVDHQGRPVLWMPVVRYDIKGLLENGMKADCFRYSYQILKAVQQEISSQTNKESGVTQFVVIVDSAELTWTKVTHFETIQCVLQFAKEFDAYYPELLHSCYIVNAPWLFSKIFNLLKPILSKRTLSKISIFDSNEENWKNVLVNNIPASAVPEDYGGTAPKVLTVYDNTEFSGEE